MKKENGITLTVLVITIIVLVIISGITINEGMESIQRSELENLKTNMLLIKAKGKEYAENSNFKLGTNIEKVSKQDKTKRIETAEKELVGEKIIDYNILDKLNVDINNIPEYTYYYKLTEDNLNFIGLGNIKLENEEIYIIKYNIKDVSIEIYNSIGFEYEGNTYYSLTDLEKLEI